MFVHVAKTIFPTEMSNINSMTDTNAPHQFKPPFNWIRILRARRLALSLQQFHQSADIAGAKSLFQGVHSAASCAIIEGARG